MAMDTYDGWPLGGSLNDNFVPKAGEAIIAGMFVKRDAQGELVKADATTGEKAFFALENQSDNAVIEAKKMAVITHNATMLTDQFQADTYGYDTDLMVDNANPGTVKPHGGGAQPIVGHSDGYLTRDGITYLKIILHLK